MRIYQLNYDKEGTKQPSRLCSPHTIFLRHSGHIFEIATALVSLLLALNYNAYVVSGYATEDVAKRIMMRVDSPYPEIKEEEKPPEDVKLEGKYALKPVRDLRSKFLLWLEQREIDRLKEIEKKEEEKRQKQLEEMEKPPHDNLYGWRVHSWILVLTGRDVEVPMFIEPSTGYSHPIDSPLYISIESIWNNYNYWVNMQDKSIGIGTTDFDFLDVSKWEHLLIGEPSSTRQQEFPADMDEQEKLTATIMAEKHLDVPPPWSSKIDIPHNVFRRRFPRGKKETMYKRTIVEEYSDHAQVNGIVAKVHRFTDLECTPEQKMTVEELYEHREDFMVKIIRDCNSDWVTEYFRDGREDCCKKHSYHFKKNVLESERIIEYYNEIRNDCLSKLEIGENFITEHFIGREDKFYYRHTIFAKKGQPPPGMLESRRRIVTHITEKFERNFNVDVSNDVAIRVFDLIERQIHLKYHYGKDNVTASTRHFVKPPVEEMGELMKFNDKMTFGYQADIDAKPLRKLQLFLMFEQIIKEEELCLYHIRDLEDQISDFIRLRFKEIVRPKLKISLFDRDYNLELMEGMREQEKKKEESKVKELAEEVDYLYPYLARLGFPTKLSIALAQKVRSQCLSDFKQLLVKRINTVQKAYEKTKADIEEKQKQFAAAQDTLSFNEEEDFYTALNDLFFYARSLEIRLQRYRELSPHRYFALEGYLDMHPALAVLREPINYQ